MRLAQVIVVALAVGGAGAAEAAPHHILVLRADGAKVDAAARGRIDAAVLALAKRLDGEVTQGDITYADASTAVGCGGDATACGDLLLDGLGADEVITVSVSPVPGGEVTVTVTHIGRGSVHEASGTVPASDPDRPLADAVGSLFGAPRLATAAATTGTGTSPTTVTATTTVPTTETPSTGEPSGTQLDPATATAPTEPVVTAAPAGVVTAPEGRHTSRLVIGAVAGGGGLAVIGLLLWSKASSLQGDIKDAPTRTRADLLHLQDLESSADAYAFWGNVTFVGGVALAGVGGYLWWRGRHRSDQRQARIAPLLLDHGAGLSLTFGGSP